MLTTAIEAALKGMEESTFQNYVKHLLSLEGYDLFNSPGGTIAKNKTRKGGPDILFQDGDKYICCECTTLDREDSESKFLNKLANDVDHSFTGRLPKEKISGIILAFNSQLHADEFEELKKRVAAHQPGTILTVYGIQKLAVAACRHPGITGKYMPEINLGKGVILSLSDFMTSPRIGIQPSLKNPFVGREVEIAKCLDSLNEKDVLLLAGKPGYGKTKLATHLASMMERDRGYIGRVIIWSTESVTEDFNLYCPPTDKYIIVVDDGDRVLSNLTQLLALISVRPQGAIKIIITVRDGVRHRLIPTLEKELVEEFRLERLEDHEIETVVNHLVPDGGSFTNHALQKIVTISKGNCRIALMAASIALKNEDPSILNNALTVYDKYFSYLPEEVSPFGSRERLIALGILSFFTAMDIDSPAHQAKLRQTFSIDWSALRTTFEELEKLELVEIFNNETVKISDQVLSTYCFFKAFLDANTRKLSYSELVSNYISPYEFRVNESFIDAINSFGFDEIKGLTIEMLQDAKQKVENDESRLYNFYSCFWYIFDVDTLAFVNKWIESLPGEAPLTVDGAFPRPSNYNRSSKHYVELLSNFWNTGHQLSKPALKIGLQLLFKQPSRIEDLLRHFGDVFSIKVNDEELDYSRQNNLLDVLESEHYTAVQQHVTEIIFITTAPSLLAWQSNQVRRKSNNKFAVATISMGDSVSIINLRNRVLRHLFSLFKKHPSQVLSVLETYAFEGMGFNRSIYKAEMSLIESFIATDLSKENYRHCKLVISYEKTLRKNKLSEPGSFAPFINSSIVDYAKILTYDYLGSNRNTSDEALKTQIVAFLTKEPPPSVPEIVQAFLRIQSDAYGHTNSAFALFLNALSERQPDQFLAALDVLIRADHDLRSSNESWAIWSATYNRHVDVSLLYEHISHGTYRRKQLWKQRFFEGLRGEDITPKFTLEFLLHLQNLSDRIYAQSLASYDRYSAVFGQLKDKPFEASRCGNFVEYAVGILLGKGETFEVIFDRNACQTTAQFLTGNPTLLRRLYLYQWEKNQEYDYDGQEIEAVARLDVRFLLDFIVALKKPDALFSSRDLPSLVFIWELEGYEEILDEAITMMIAKFGLLSSFEHQANAFFRRGTDVQGRTEKMLLYLSDFISKHYSEETHTRVIMNVVAHSFPSEKLRFFRELMLKEPDPELVARIDFGSGGVISGSLIPRFTKQIEFIKCQIEIVKSLDDPLLYADLLKGYENRIKGLQNDIRRETKSDFLRE